MKKIAAVLLIIVLFLVGCGSSTPPEEPTPEPDPNETVETVEPDPVEEVVPEPEPEPATDEVLLLDGEYISTDDLFPSVAVIKEGHIIIRDVFEDTSSLYWVGSAPESLREGESFISDGDTEEMADALLASTEETKEFTLEDGKLVYVQGAMGVETTVYLEKQES